MQDKDPISISFVTEKIVGHGEDAPPLLITKGQAYAVGVFDGMGGAGAAICNSSLGDGFTKAYVASRIVSASMNNYLHNHLSTNDVSIEDMKEEIRRNLLKEQERYKPKVVSSLRSKLVRDYPTTMAVVTAIEKDNTILIDSYWAGDSHCYLWTKEGLSQISKDDLEADNDPMENLSNDSPISNCICADRNFDINHIHIELPKQPIAIISATDGCFGYYPTPMHFEFILKKSLQEVKDATSWGIKIEKYIQKVTGDDTSLSLIAVGFDSFKMLKKLFGKNPVEGMGSIWSNELRIKELEKELAQRRINLNHAIESGWLRYKNEYMKHLNSKNDADA
jgi:hypothetical protein